MSEKRTKQINLWITDAEFETLEQFSTGVEGLVIKPATAAYAFFKVGLIEHNRHVNMTKPKPKKAKP